MEAVSCWELRDAMIDLENLLSALFYSVSLLAFLFER
jgi:hypothetical protein